MARNRLLARNFELRHTPGWQHASVTGQQIDRLQETVARVLQPIRTHYGVPVRITSWTTWSSGELRDGAHAHGGTVDFTVDGGLTREAFEWAAEQLVPSGYIGRLIYEPARAATETQPRQGEHIHLAPRAAMLETVGDPSIQVLEETAEGQYRFFRQAAGVGLGLVAAAAGLWLFLASRPQPVTG